MATGFFTDTTLCIGCKACEVACKQWNELPSDGFSFTGNSYDNTSELSGTTWRHVAFVEQMAVSEAGIQDRWLMSSDVCKHCTNAGCLEACPTGAIVRNEFDSVFIQPDVCNGCGYCVVSCPVRRRRPDREIRSRRHALQPRFADRRTARRTRDRACKTHGGVAGKCTLCYDRQKLGVTPACAKACPTESIQFGDVDELRDRAKQRVNTLQARGVQAHLVRGRRRRRGDRSAQRVLSFDGPTRNVQLAARTGSSVDATAAGYTAAAAAAIGLAIAGWMVFRNA